MSKLQQINPGARHGDGPRIGPAPPAAAGLDDLTAAVRAAVDARADWSRTAALVATELERHLPAPGILTAEQRAGDPETYQSHVLHSEPDGSFSIVALVWRPGQVTRIHDHVTWCVFGVIQGIEYEEQFTLDESSGSLVEAGYTVNEAGDVSGFAPPGDIHRVRNAGDRAGTVDELGGLDVAVNNAAAGSPARHRSPRCPRTSSAACSGSI